MKYLVIAIGFSSLQVLAFGQEVVKEFSMSYFADTGDINYSISAVEDKDQFKYYVSMYSMDATAKQVILMLENNAEIDSFKSDLSEAAKTYSKWDSVSVANNVVDLNKEMAVESKKLEAGFTYGDWNFDFNVSLSYRFKHIDGAAFLLISTGELQSGSNEYIDCDGGMLIFSDREEIDGFIEALDVKYATAYFDEKNSKEDLFTD